MPNDYLKHAFMVFSPEIARRSTTSPASIWVSKDISVDGNRVSLFGKHSIEFFGTDISPTRAAYTRETPSEEGLVDTVRILADIYNQRELSTANYDSSKDRFTVEFKVEDERNMYFIIHSVERLIKQLSL